MAARAHLPPAPGKRGYSRPAPPALAQTPDNRALLALRKHSIGNSIPTQIIVKRTLLGICQRETYTSAAGSEECVEVNGLSP